MAKLNQPQINEICRQMNVGKLTIWRVAKHAGVSQRWIRELYKHYLQQGKPPVRQRCGRKLQPMPLAIRQKIKLLYSVLPCGAVSMEQRLAKQGVKASHNKIHEFMREEKLAKREPKKSKRRKWVRYERRKANSLWHTDFTTLENKQLILFEDDATRLVTGYGLFDRATAENALQVYAVATANYGVPRQLLSDNGSHFCNTHDKKNERHVFHKAVVSSGCEHIFTRPSHPQCNGKLERLNYTIKQLYKYYNGNLEHAVKMYNEERLHMSLEWATPLEAWRAKLAKGLKYKQPIKT